MIIAILKKKKKKLESSQKKIYFYKLDFYLNKITIQSFIIHLTYYIYSQTKTFDFLLPEDSRALS